MENEKMYYEKKLISKPIDVKTAYEYAVANNFKYYRCVSGKGDLYGWDGRMHIKAPAGVEWFENPNYTTPIKTEIADNESTIDTDALVENIIKSDAVETVGKAIPIETEKEHKSALELLREKMAERNAMIESVTVELNEARDEINRLLAENSRIQSELSVKSDECDNIMAENAKMAAECAEFKEIVNSIDLL